MLDPMTEMWAEVHDRLSQEGKLPGGAGRGGVAPAEVAQGASPARHLERHTYPHVVAVKRERIDSI